MKILLTILCILTLSGCGTTYPNKELLGKQFITVTGQSLAQKTISIPTDFENDYTLLLIGYKQDSQFDIDRWLIALDMAGIAIPTYELPTIAGLAPRMFSPFIDNGMRKGIPKEMWAGVITIYSDGEQVQKFTGNENPNNARVVLLDADARVLYFYDEGFAVSALNTLKQHILL